MALSILVAGGWAAERKGAKVPKLANPRRARAGKRKLTMDSLRDELNLTSSQEAQVEQLYQTHRQAIANWMGEHGPEYRDLIGRIREAKKSRDREADREVQQKLRTLMVSRERVVETFLEQLGDVLNEDQMAKARVLFGRPGASSRRRGEADPLRILSALRGVDLSPQQRARTMEILTAAVKSIRQEVLSDAQRKKLESLVQSGGRPLARDPLLSGRLMAELERLDLTDAQKSRIAALQREALPKVTKADGAREKRAVTRDLHKQIVEDVLTAEQRRALTKGLRPPRKDRSAKKRRGGDGT